MCAKYEHLFGSVGSPSWEAIVGNNFARSTQDRACLSPSSSALSSMSVSDTTLQPLFIFLSRALEAAEYAFFKLPGSAVIARYVKSSHQNDPGRTLLEAILLLFAIRTLLQSRTRADRSGKNFVQYTEQVRRVFYTCFPIACSYPQLFRKLTSWWRNGHPNPLLNHWMKLSRVISMLSRL